MYTEINKSQIISSLFWKLMERGGAQGIQFIVQILLARLLMPEDYGSIALVLVFIAIANVFVESGFNTALIQKKVADEADFSSVFYLSLSIASIFYLVLFFSAPYITAFFNMPDLIPVLRVFSVILFLGAFRSIQNAVIARNMQFKYLFFSSSGAILVSGILGIITAYIGWGVWALVTYHLTNHIITFAILWFTVKWRPKLIFSFIRVKVLFSYGWRILVSGILSELYNEIRTLIIGRIYGSAMLGFYNRGQQFPKLIIGNIDGSLQAVMFPALSAHQDNQNRVKDMVRRTIMTSSFIIFPMMIGLAIIAEPLVRLVLTEKWIQAVPFLRIFSITFALWPIHSTNLQAIRALGRSDIYLRISIIKKVVGLVILIFSLPYGIYTIALGALISSVISTYINAYPNQNLINYSFKEQFNNIAPSLILSLMMGLIIYFISWLQLSDLLIILLQTSLGIIIYTGFAKILKIESYQYISITIKALLKKKNIQDI